MQIRKLKFPLKANNPKLEVPLKQSSKRLTKLSRSEESVREVKRKEREKKKTTTEAVIASANNLIDELRMAPPPPPALLVLPESRRFAIFRWVWPGETLTLTRTQTSILVNIIFCVVHYEL